MNSITINGVNFNIDAVSKISFDAFMVHPMHENHWPHLKQADHDKAIAEAYDIIQSTAPGEGANDGNTNGDDRTGSNDEPADGINIAAGRGGNKGDLFGAQSAATRQGNR